MSQKIKIYYHIAELPGWQELVDEKIGLMKASGLWEACAEIHLLMHYSSEPFQQWATQFVNDARVKLIYFTNSCRPLGECYSNRYIWQDCWNEPDDFYLFRFHTKGLYQRVFPHWPVAEKWNEYYDYWNIEQWADCVAALADGYDLAGANWHPPAHFSGNIWWAQSTYIKTLPILPLPHLCNFTKQIAFAYSNRHDAESWVGLANPTVKEFHHYEHACVYHVEPPSNFQL